MLRDLHVRNLAVLSEVSLEFGPGLNVLTGETGAGKSLLVDSLSLLMGGRASGDLIRTGADLLAVTGVFEPAGDECERLLTEAGLGGETGVLVVRREISREGRNRVFVNDQPTTLRLLSELAPHLLKIHVQREELGLLSSDQQMRWLDLSAGAEAVEVLARVADAHAEYRSLAERLAASEGDERLRLERIDLLRFQASEIDAARVGEKEDVELQRERDLLRNSEAVSEGLGNSLELLFDQDGAASERVHQAMRSLEAIEAWVEGAAEWRSELDTLRIRLDELVRSIRAAFDGVRADPGRLDAIEERLAVLDRLRRKYGKSCAEILEYRRRIEAELEDLVADDEQREELGLRVTQALAAYREAAITLSESRGRWATELASGVHGELADLAMEKARFRVGLGRRRLEGSPLEIESVPVEFGARGVDVVGFELTSNPGEESKPLARVASGGEISRVYLSLQLAVRQGSEAERPALVFDEIDSGLGGAEAAALGRKLQRLAPTRQVLAVTHMPQVASFADRHYKVVKRVVGERSYMEVETLGERGRVEEIARMLAGKQVTSLSRSHAEELIAVSSRS